MNENYWGLWSGLDSYSHPINIKNTWPIDILPSAHLISMEVEQNSEEVDKNP
jgi:hypothetical protein